jgi:hypothetical protein
MLASRRWRDWKPPQEFPKAPEYQPTELTKPTSVSSDSSRLARLERIKVHSKISRPDSEAWREPVSEWLESECVRHQRCHSSVTSLHRAYCDWELSKGDAPCPRGTFEELLGESGFLIAGKLVSGLILRTDFDGVRIYPDVDRLLC